MREGETQETNDSTSATSSYLSTLTSASTSPLQLYLSSALTWIIFLTIKTSYVGDHFCFILMILKNDSTLLLPGELDAGPLTVSKVKAIFQYI